MNLHRTLLFATALALASAGCSKSHKIDLVVTVVNVADSAAIEGVTIHRNMWGERTDPKTAETVLITDADGRASERFTAPANAFDSGQPPWLLRLSKAGFEPTTVEFKPAKAPTTDVTLLEVRVEMHSGK